MGDKDEVLTFVRNLDKIDLSRFSVIGDYVRYQESTRNSLKRLKDGILSCFEKPRGQENYLIWGAPGCGKSFFVQQIGKRLRDRVKYEELNLSELSRSQVETKLKELNSVTEPLLCFVDEVDSKKDEEWPFELFLRFLEPRETRAARWCVVLAGSTGESLEQFLDSIRLRANSKGKDMLSRIPERDSYAIPTLDAKDKVIVALVQLLKAARETHKELLEVEKLALFYIALQPSLGSARELRAFAEKCVERMPRSDDQLKYDYLFEAGDLQNKEFWSRYKELGLVGSFVSVEISRPQAETAIPSIEPTEGDGVTLNDDRIPSDVQSPFRGVNIKNDPRYLRVGRTTREPNRLESGLASTLDANLVDEVAKANCVLFIGPDLSISSGLPSAKDLLRKLAADLGLDIDEYDPSDVAQFYASEYAQGRHLLLQHIRDEILKTNAHPTASHYLLKVIFFKTIVTTNYDTLIEEALESEPPQDYRRVVLNSGIGDWKDDMIQLMKIFGSVDTEELIVSKSDFESFKEKYPQIDKKLKGLLTDKTFVFIGYKFDDPNFAYLRNEFAASYDPNRRPMYLVSSSPNRFEIEDSRRRGINIVDIGKQGDDEALRINEFLTALRQQVRSRRRGLGINPPNQTRLIKAFLDSRLSLALSLTTGPELMDDHHHYELLSREDLLDYNIGTYRSVRRLVGTNMTARPSDHLVYAEASEAKLRFEDLTIIATDLISGASLRVEPLAPGQRGFFFPFKILFTKPLEPGERFDVKFFIAVPGELKVYSIENEIDSVSLARILDGPDVLEFNVVWNHKPNIYYMSELGDEGAVRLGELPRLEMMPPDYGGVPWTCKNPYRLSWRCTKPTGVAYFYTYGEASS